MVPSSNLETESPLGAVTRAVGPDFAWLRIGETQSRCIIHSGDLVLAPVVLPSGLRSIVDSFTSVVPVPREKAAELLYGGALSEPSMRAATRAGLEPLANRVREIVGSLEADGRPIRSVILDMPGGAMPGLPQALQELWPNQKVVPLESLGLHSPEEIPAVITPPPIPASETPRPAAAVVPLVSAPLASAPLAGAAPLAAAVPLLGSAAEAVGETTPARPDPAPPAAQPVPALPLVSPEASGAQEHVTSGSAFIAWLTWLTFLALVLCILYLLQQFQAINNRLDTLSTRLGQIFSRQEANAPHTIIQGAPQTSIPNGPQTLIPPMVQTLPPQGRTSIVTPGKPFAGAMLPGVTGPGILDLPTTRGGGPGAGLLAGSIFGGGGGSGGPKYGGSGNPGGPGSFLADAAGGSGFFPGTASAEPAAPFNFLPVPAATGSTLVAMRPTAGPGEFATLAPGGFDTLAPFPAPTARSYGATTPVAATLTLPDVLRQAAVRGLGPLAAQYRAEESDARFEGDLSPYNLSYGLEGNFSTSTNLGFARPDLGNRYVTLSAQYPLDLWNHRRALKGEADAAHTGVTMEVAAAQETTLYDAAQAYLDARQAQEDVAARREMLQVEQQQLRTSRARLAEGFVSRLDVDEAASRVATAQNELATALAAAELAELRLGAAVRSTPGSRVQPDPSDSWLPIRAAALESQPALTLASSQLSVLQAQANVRQQEAAVTVARKGKDPKVNVYAGVEPFGTGIRSPQPFAGLNFAYPFNDGGANRAAVRASQAALREAQVTYQQALDKAALDISSAQVDVRNSQSHVAPTTEAVIRQRDVLRGTQLRYEAGSASFSDVLTAETQLEGALRAQAEAHMAAFRNELNFLRATGRLRTLQVG